jgi:hypothetical protein
MALQGAIPLFLPDLPLIFTPPPDPLPQGEGEQRDTPPLQEESDRGSDSVGVTTLENRKGGQAKDRGARLFNQQPLPRRQFQHLIATRC